MASWLSLSDKLFGKFARTQLRPFYRKLYAAKCAPLLATAELRTLRWWAEILASPKPRIPRGVDRIPDFVVYTDAATKSNKMAAMAIHRVDKQPSIFQLLVSHTPKFWRKHLHPRNIIMGCEIRPH